MENMKIGDELKDIHEIYNCHYTPYVFKGTPSKKYIGGTDVDRVKVKKIICRGSKLKKKFACKESSKDDIKFESESHTYYFNGAKCKISVTGCKKTFSSSVFDESRFTQKQLDSFAIMRDAGTAVHEVLELMSQGSLDIPKLVRECSLRAFDGNVDGAKISMVNYMAIAGSFFLSDLQHYLESNFDSYSFHPEKLLAIDADGEMVGGAIDLIVVTRKGDETRIMIFDYKTTKFSENLVQSSRKKMLFPFQCTDDNKMGGYRVQLSFYSLGAARELEVPYDKVDCFIVQLRRPSKKNADPGYILYNVEKIKLKSMHFALKIIASQVRNEDVENTRARMYMQSFLPIF